MLLEMDVKLRRGNFVLNSQLVLDDINTGLFGKTGAGKSTIMGLIAGTKRSNCAGRQAVIRQP